MGFFLHGKPIMSPRFIMHLEMTATWSTCILIPPATSCNPNASLKAVASLPMSHHMSTAVLASANPPTPWRVP